MKRRIGIFSSIALLFAACGGSVGGSGARVTATGGIGFRLQLPNGVNVSGVDYTISGPASYQKNGSLSLASDMTFAGTIDGIPVGDGYVITLSTHGAFPDAECDGSANFSVRANLVTAVGIRLQCPGLQSDTSAAGTASSLVAAGSGGGSAATMQSAMAMGGSPAATTQTNANSIAGNAGVAGTSTGGNPAIAMTLNTLSAGSGSVMQSVMSSGCPRIDCVSAVPSADGMSVSLHGVALGTSESDQHTFAWTASAGTLSDASGTDPVLQCPASARDIEVAFRVLAGTCSDELQMHVTCAAATAH